MSSIIFPKWPERALFALVVASVGIIMTIAVMASDKFGADVVISVLLGGLPSVAIFVLMAYLVRRYRLKTETRAREYDRVLQGLAIDG